MRTHTALAVALLAACLAVNAAETFDLQLENGKQYKACHVVRVLQGGLAISHQDGVARIPFEKLPKEIQERYGYDAAKVAAEKAAVARAWSEQKRFEQEQIAKGLVKYGNEWVTQEESARRNSETERRLRKEKLKSIREVETDQSAFLYDLVVLSGTIDVDNYYNWGYEDAQEEFYSFRIQDDTGAAHVYARREDAYFIILRKMLLEAGSAMRGSFSIWIRRERFDKNSSEILAELVSYGPPVE